MPRASSAAAASTALKLVSRGLPTYVSSGTASDATDSDYSTQWSASGVPATIAIDISTIVGAIVADGSGYKPMVLSWTDGFTEYGAESGNMDSYTVEVNSAAGGGSAPGSGWTTVATVTGNIYSARAHLFNVAGQNWVRLNISTSSASCNVDLFDASNSANAGHTAVAAGGLLVADSIGRFGLGLDPQGLPGSPLSIGDQVKALLGGAYTPLTQNAGKPGWDTTTGTFGWLQTQGSATWFENAVAQFPGKWVHVLLGTNDANAGIGSAYYTNLVTMKNICVTYGKIMVVHTTPWSSNSNIVANRAAIDQGNADIVANFPGTVIAGADRYTYFNNNQSLIGGDGVHPTGDGYVGQRTLVATRIAAIGAGA